MSQLRIKEVIDSEAAYWRMVNALPGKGLSNIKTRAGLILTHFIEADENKKRDPNHYKKQIK